MPQFRKQLVAVIPHHGNDTRFHDRVFHWNKFISGNALQEKFETILIAPNQYEEHVANLGAAFDKVKFIDGRQYGEMIASRIPVNIFLDEVVQNLDSIKCFLFAANEPNIRRSSPHAVALHFEAGMLSRGSMPQLIQYDPIGLYNESSLLELEKLNIDEGELGQYEGITRSARDAFLRTLQINKNSLSETFLAFSSRFERLAILALPKENDGSVPLFLGKKVAGQELVEFALSVLPLNVGILVTTHPAENMPVACDEFVVANQARVLFMPTVGGTTSSSFFPFADTIIVINSMTGAQAKLAGLKMLCSEKHPLRVFADSLISINKNAIVSVNNVHGGSINLSLGYLLSYLHLPSYIWNGGYGRAYIEHFLRGDSIATLWQNPACRENLKKVSRYYESFLKLSQPAP